MKAFETYANLSKPYALAGTGWGKYVIGPLQFGICFAAVIGGALLGGQSLKVSCSIHDHVDITFLELVLENK